MWLLMQIVFFHLIKNAFMKTFSVNPSSFILGNNPQFLLVRCRQVTVVDPPDQPIVERSTTHIGLFHFTRGCAANKMTLFTTKFYFVFVFKIKILLCMNEQG